MKCYNFSCEEVNVDNIVEEKCVNILTIPPNNPLNRSSAPQLLCGKYSHYMVKGKHLAHYPECCPENCPLLDEGLVAEFAK